MWGVSVWSSVLSRQLCSTTSGRQGDKAHPAQDGPREGEQTHPCCPKAAPAHTPLGQGLLLVDAHIEEDWLHAQQHAALDLSGQGVEERAWQGDPHIKPITGGG